MAATASDGLGEIIEGSDLRAAGAAHKVTLTLKIRRYNPEVRGQESVVGRVHDPGRARPTGCSTRCTR